MKKLTYQAQECNVIPTATTKNNTTSTESIFKENVSSSSGAKQSQTKQIPRREKTHKELIDADIKAFVKAQHPEQIKEWVFFNRGLAEVVGITGAILTYGLYTWIKSRRPSFGYNPTINGRKACYRSTRELAEEDYLGLWDDTTMLQTINRIEAKEIGLIVDRTNVQFHFAMSDKLLRTHESKKGFLGFRIADALKYGVMEAILLANLDFQLDTFANCLTDDADLKHGELSPTKLTKFVKDESGVSRRIIPKSKDAISDALQHLKKDAAIVAHPTRMSFYRRVQDGEVVPLSAHLKTNRREAKVSSGEAKISSLEAKVSSLNEVLSCNRNETNSLCQISETIDSNTDRNLDRKCLLTETPSLRSGVPVPSSNLSPNAKKLMELVADDLKAIRQELAEHPPKPFCIDDYAVYKVDDFDKLSISHYELDFDCIPWDYRTGTAYCRRAEIDYTIDDLKLNLQSYGLISDPQSIRDLRQIFVEHHSLDYESFGELLRFVTSEEVRSNNAKKPKGFDEYYWARRTKSLKFMLRYLPQIVKEWYAYYELDWCDIDLNTDMPIFDYTEMQDPYYTLALNY